MFSSSGYFRGVTCPYYASGLCERPHCHFRHVKADGFSTRTKAAMPESILRQSVAVPGEISTGHRGLPVTVTMPTNTRKPALLSRVGDAIKQLQRDIEIDKAHIQQGAVAGKHLPVVQPPVTTYNPTPIPRTRTPKAESQAASTSGAPRYTPTPISVLKKGGPASTSSSRKKSTTLEYDPTSATQQHQGGGLFSQGAERVTLESSTHGKRRHERDASSVSKKVKIDESADYLEAKFSDEEEDVSMPTADQIKSEPNNIVVEPENEKDKEMGPEIVTVKEEVKLIVIEPKIEDDESRDDDVILVGDGPDQSKTMKNVIVLEDDDDTNDAAPSKDKKRSHSGKDSEKENKSSSRSRHKSNKHDKDRHRHHSSDSSHSHSDRKRHSSDKDKHRSCRDSHRSKHHSSHKSSSKSRDKDKTRSSSRGSSSHSKKQSSSHSSHRQSKDKHKSSSRDRERHSSSSSDKKPSLKKTVSHADLFGNDSDDEKGTKTVMKKIKEEVDSDDVISLSSSTLEDAEFMKDPSRHVENPMDGFDDDDLPLFSSKKRVAHNPTQESLMKKVNIEKKKAKPTPAQIMLERYRALQKEAEKRDTDKGDGVEPSTSESQTPTLSNNGKSRVAHAPRETPPPNRGLGLLNKRRGSLAKSWSLSAGSGAKPLSTPCGSTSGKRQAHVPKQPLLKRPLVQSEPGSKVPTNIRQRYLNQFIDECLKIYPGEQESFDRAVNEEKSVYARSGSKKIYLNNCINTIRKLRSENNQNKPNGAAPIKNPKVLSHQALLGGAKAASTSFTVGRCGSLGKIEDVKGADLHKLLFTYALNYTQLQENEFPLPDPTDSDKVVLKIPDYVKTPPKKDGISKVCTRCGKVFQITPKGKYVKDEDCVYHWGKAFKRKIAGAIESRYTCCQTDAGSKGCQIAKQHVFEINKYENLTGYAMTQSKPSGSSENLSVYALDCEMVYTTLGQELARLTVVDSDGNIALEQIIKPSHPIVDYNTRFSGMKAEDFEGVTITIGDVQDMLLDMFSDKTILIGHSLESDLIALKLVHKTVVDTSVVFPHRLGPPYKRALKNLCGEYLKRIIQDDVGGHDSAEDAKSALDLMLYKVKEDVKKKYRRS